MYWDYEKFSPVYKGNIDSRSIRATSTIIVIIYLIFSMMGINKFIYLYTIIKKYFEVSNLAIYLIRYKINKLKL